MSDNQNDARKSLQIICSLIEKHGGIKRLAKLFKTKEHGYLYDSGTGKILCCNPDEFSFFSWLFHNASCYSFEDLSNCIDNDNLDNLLENVLETITRENLLQMPFITQFLSPDHKERLEDVVDKELRMITLEMTEKCNLRCGYCIYNESYTDNRDFSTCEINQETVKAAIDMLCKHSGDDVAVCFYGGEPLLKFDLIKYAVEYSQKIMKNKKLSFSITTNLTLLTREIAEFFASTDGFSVLCSIDGPEYIQNQYRKYPNGEGSFDAAIKGLRNLAEAYDEKRFLSSVGLSMVFAPPYTKKKIIDIQEFFDRFPWLPKGIDKSITYPQPGSVSDEVLETGNIANLEVNEVSGSLLDWTSKKLVTDSKTDDVFTGKYINDYLLRVHNRPISDKPFQPYGFNGCCVPGNRRLYICADGTIKPCERMGSCPSIGNVFTGINTDYVKKHFVNDFENGSISDCNNCWAFHICGVCYTHSYTEHGFDIDKKRIQCSYSKETIFNTMTLYHELLENGDEVLTHLNNIRTS